ncbi:hypothetical protein CVT26_015462 [Gymnopilus dilepis]|uniref:Uncharacterized protein n=1 Tax=Gymnopilus dilepis TaxID=231916 RepID=A0A409WM14_9AGAR|nr:hypothetical protein CVT26_015462 [Gymnopilus dilepis]
MSTSSLPSAWETPHQFYLPLPFDLDSVETDFLLACSTTHLVLWYDSHLYVYSLPAFDLVHILSSEELSIPQSIKIYGTILVAKCENVNDVPDGFVGDCSLSFWDLSVGESLGTMILPVDVGVSTPETEVVEIEENGRLLREEWPKIPTVIICSPEGQFLRIYTLDHSMARNPQNNMTDNVQRSPAMFPSMLISPIHWAPCHASMGRTAVTGGFDASVRVWDIITGQCRLVLIGHRSGVMDVRLDKTRIYSLSSDDSARIWDRHGGDCLHTLDYAPVHAFSSLDITPSYLIITTFLMGGGCKISVWDPISGRLAYQIGNQTARCLGPIRGKDRTLVTWGVDGGSTSGSSTYWLRTWDIKSGNMLTSFPIVPDSGSLRFDSQGRFLMAVVKYDGEYLLEVWDFAPETR